MAMDSGTSTITFNVLDVDIEGKAINV